MQQKVNPSYRPKTKERVIEAHLEKAWRKIEGGMSIEAFTQAAQEAAAIVALRASLAGRIASGDVVPGKIKLRCAS